MKSLFELYREHQGKVSDKWSIYLSEYDRLFSNYRGLPLRMLEIGIQNGGSLEIWNKYFPNAQVLVGCDINPDCANLEYGESNIHIVVGDANADETEAIILARSVSFDIIIDDGSHTSGDIVKTFARYFRHLNQGGVFVAEDLHCSYWREFDGGLYYPYSSISFFKRLADVVNHEHWGVEKGRKQLLQGFAKTFGTDFDELDLREIHSIEFFNSVCVVHKRAEQLNVLGERYIAGQFEAVIPGLQGLVGRSLTLSQLSNPWSDMAEAPDENWEKLSKAVVERNAHITSLEQSIVERDAQIVERDAQIAERDAQIAERDAQIAERDAQIAERDAQIAERDAQIAERDAQIAALMQEVDALRDSTSWRLTKPIRTVGHQIARAKHLFRVAPNAFRMAGGPVATLNKAFALYKREGLPGIKRGIRIAQTGGEVKPAVGSEGFDRNDYQEWVRRYDTLDEVKRINLRERCDGLTRKPKISVVMPTYNPKPAWLIEAIESVRSQIYPNWEMCIADDASPNPEIRSILERYMSEDERIKVVFRAENGHISAASNSALELATGEWVALLDHDDLLTEHAFVLVAEAINSNPTAGLIFSDEDKIDEMGNRLSPYFKCEFNLDLLRSQNMICHLGIYRTDLVKGLGGFRLGFEGAQDYDLALRVIESLSTNQIVHVPYVLYHWRIHAESTAQSSKNKGYAQVSGLKALREHLQRMSIDASVELTNFHQYRIRYSIPTQLPKVSLIIPTRNGLHLIRQCVESILTKTTYKNYEILIVDNGTDDPETLMYFSSFHDDPRVKVLRDDRPFNYSALNNGAVAHVDGEYIGLLNNDLEVITPEWLDEMLGLASQPGKGAIGACLWYPNDTLQHGGVILGIGGVAGHSSKLLPRGQIGYFGRAASTQGFSAVTAACLLIKKSIYLEVGGLNEVDLQIAFNDVDLCLKVREAGYQNVWTPFAELYHHESATRGLEDTPEKQARFVKEVDYMMRAWGHFFLNDPAYNPNLTLDHEDFSLAWPTRAPALWSHSCLPDIHSIPQHLDRVAKTTHMIKKDGLGLEIGPSHNPITPKKAGYNVHVLDHASAEALRVKYADHPINLDNIEEVDFIWSGEPLSELIGREHCYDWIVASHVIEHVTDFVDFLRQCEKLLAPGGVISLVIPDKRYCFDYYRWPSSTGDVLQAFSEGRTRHSAGTIFDYFANVANMDKAITWTSTSRGDVKMVHTLEEAESYWEMALKDEKYIDCHSWKFTPSSFRIILNDLQKLGLTELVEIGGFDTDGFEFWITLGKRQPNLKSYDRQDLFRKMMCEIAESIKCQI